MLKYSIDEHTRLTRNLAGQERRRFSGSSGPLKAPSTPHDVQLFEFLKTNGDFM